MTQSRVVGTVVTALLVLLAGCGAGTVADTPTADPTPEPTSTPMGAPTGTATEEPAPATPAPQEEIVVSIDNPTNRSYAPLIQSAIDYWEANDDRYGTYTTDWRLEPNASDADVSFVFRSEIFRCDYEEPEDTLGCAPYFNEPPDSGVTERVLIKTGYTNNSTLKTIKHEFGHVYGIEHGEEPMPLMAPTSVANRTPQTDAINRSVPWESDNISIYVDSDSFGNVSQSELNNQISNTLKYFNDAEGDTPENVTFIRISNRSNADIVVTSQDLDGETASTADVVGRQLDTDAALEYYVNVTIRIDGGDVPAENIGWHVGYWLDSSVNPDETSAPFSGSASRQNWWFAAT